MEGTQQAAGDDVQVIAQHTRGLIFLGTPFQGSRGAKPAEFVRRILIAVHFETQEKTLKLLGVDSERLAVLNRAFPDCMRQRMTSKKPEDKIQAMFFFELLKTSGRLVILRQRNQIAELMLVTDCRA